MCVSITIICSLEQCKFYIFKIRSKYNNNYSTNHSKN